MPDFSKLPLLVISKIFDHSIVGFKDISFKYKANYLKICSSWRKVAVSYYYEVVYYNGNQSEDREEEVFTNADLITSVGCTAYARRITIGLYNIGQIVEFLNNYQSLFQAENTDWSRISQFDIYSPSTLAISHQAEYNGRMVNLHDKFIEFANYITTHILSIKELTLFYRDTTRTANLATEIFLDAYSRQLTNLYGNYISCFHNDYIFDNLTTLELFINPDALDILPKVNYSKIVHLLLGRIPYSFKWNDLFADTDIDEFTFERLENLVLNFSIDYTKEEYTRFIASQQMVHGDFKFKVRFPELKHLTLGYAPSWHVSRKTKYYFSNSFTHLATHCFYDVHGMMENIDCKRLKCCDVFYLNWNSAYADAAYQTTNLLFSASNCYQYDKSSFRFITEDYSIDWGKTKWTSLKKIVLRHCDISTLVSAQKHCPQLISLTVYKFSIEMPLVKVEELFKSELSCSETLGNSSSKVCKLQNLNIFEFDSNIVEKQDFSAFFKIYLKYSKYLIYLAIDGDQRMDIEETINSLKEHYPHISNIAVNYDYTSQLIQ